MKKIKKKHFFHKTFSKSKNNLLKFLNFFIRNNLWFQNVLFSGINTKKHWKLRMGLEYRKMKNWKSQSISKFWAWSYSRHYSPKDFLCNLSFLKVIHKSSFKSFFKALQTKKIFSYSKFPEPLKKTNLTQNL